MKIKVIITDNEQEYKFEVISWVNKWEIREQVTFDRTLSIFDNKEIEEGISNVLTRLITNIQSKLKQ